nr:helix-turn-helix domain-containing protein [Jidongwangia harbinensis]
MADRIRQAPGEADTATDTRADIQPDTTPDTPKRPAPAVRRPARKRDTGKAVVRLRARHPDLPAKEIARQLGVTDRTVRRHLSSAA